MARSSAQEVAGAKRKHDGRPPVRPPVVLLHRLAGRASYFVRLPVPVFVVKFHVALLLEPTLFLATTRQ